MTTLNVSLILIVFAIAWLLILKTAFSQAIRYGFAKEDATEKQLERERIDQLSQGIVDWLPATDGLDDDQTPEVYKSLRQSLSEAARGGTTPYSEFDWDSLDDED